MEEHHTHGHEHAPGHHEPEHHESKPKSKEINIKLKESTLWKFGTFLFLGLLVISLFTGGFGLGGGSDSGGSPIAPTPSPSPTGNAVSVKITDADPILGDADAKVSIVEFSDFQCPFCARAASGALTDFKSSSYFADGEVNLVYKHFPLNSIHPQAQKAAEASECANRQGKFWEYHDTLFINQQSMDVSSLKSYAAQIGLNTADFNSCLDKGEAAGKVDSDLKEATAAGGRGTPYFVIVNNDDGSTQVVSGAVPWANFESAIQAVI